MGPSFGTNVGDISIWEVGSRERCCFLKNLVQIFTYNPAGELRQHLEFHIDAHVGGVNDIAFAHPNKQLCIVTCGDDKTIKLDADSIYLKAMKLLYILSASIIRRIFRWGDIEFPLPFGRVLSPTESFIHSLDEK
ncbi:unnamed protein product [Camellia sinensis]